MPSAHGLLAPNMSVMADRAVKDHMRNAHFTGEDPRKQTRFWQLYNHCSHGFVQTYYKTVNARGKPGSKCLSKWSFWGLSGGEGRGVGATRRRRRRLRAANATIERVRLPESPKSLCFSRLQGRVGHVRRPRPSPARLIRPLPLLQPSTTGHRPSKFR